MAGFTAKEIIAELTRTDAKDSLARKLEVMTILQDKELYRSIDDFVTEVNSAILKCAFEIKFKFRADYGSIIALQHFLLNSGFSVKRFSASEYSISWRKKNHDLLESQ